MVYDCSCLCVWLFLMYTYDDDDDGDDVCLILCSIVVNEYTNTRLLTGLQPNKQKKHQAFSIFANSITSNTHTHTHTRV